MPGADEDLVARHVPILSFRDTGGRLCAGSGGLPREIPQGAWLRSSLATED
jgi:hypothetical protein